MLSYFVVIFLCACVALTVSSGSDEYVENRHCHYLERCDAYLRREIQLRGDERSRITCLMNKKNIPSNESNTIVDSRFIMPNVWLQFGKPRTATTLQFKILVLIATYLCDGKGIETSYIPTASSTKMKELMETAARNRHRLYIVKAHDHSLLQYVSQDAQIFTTSDRKDNHINDLQSVFVQDYDEVLRKGPNIVEDYSALFNLNEKATSTIINITRAWDILRLCCGAQMSLTWRYELFEQGGHSLTVDERSKMLKSGEVGYPACTQHNVTDIESQYIDNLVALPGAREIILSQSENLSDPGPTYTGFCNCSISMTKGERLKFNDDRYHVCHEKTRATNMK